MDLIIVTGKYELRNENFVLRKKERKREVRERAVEAKQNTIDASFPRNLLT